MPPLLITTALAFGGFSALLPVAPLWASHGGADSFGAGLVNGLLMLSTVATQMVVAPGLRHLGWARMLTLSMLFLGLPAVLHVFSDALWFILVLAALRGIGFGIVTVCGSSAVAALVEPERRGRAIGAYGVAIALPQFVMVPAAPWIAEQIGFPAVFVLAAAPLAGIPTAIVLGRRLAHAPTPTGSVPVQSTQTDDAQGGTGPTVRPKPTPEQKAARRRSNAEKLRAIRSRGVVMPIVALLTITCTGGAVITFAPTMLTSTTAAVVTLLLLTGLGTVSRWALGGFADRYGAHRFIAPLLGAAALGALGVAAGIRETPTPGSATALLVGAALIGIAYGGLQNVTLVEAFARAGERARNAVSVVWNSGFDLGTGLGSAVVGTLATAASFPASFIVLTVLCVVVAALVTALRPTRIR